MLLLTVSAGVVSSSQKVVCHTIFVPPPNSHFLQDLTMNPTLPPPPPPANAPTGSTAAPPPARSATTSSTNMKNKQKKGDKLNTTYIYNIARDLQNTCNMAVVIKADEDRLFCDFLDLVPTLS